MLHMDQNNQEIVWLTSVKTLIVELSITSEKNSRFGRNNCESLDNCCLKTDTDNTPVLSQRGTPCWRGLANHLKSEHLHIGQFISLFNWI